MEKQIIMSVSEYNEMLEAYNNIRDGKKYCITMIGMYNSKTSWYTDSEVEKILSNTNNSLDKEIKRLLAIIQNNTRTSYKIDNLSIFGFIRYKLSSQYRNKIKNCN